MKKSILTSVFAAVMLLFVSYNGNAQTKTVAEKSNSTATTIQVIQFHSEYRCMTCNKIEELARVALKNILQFRFLWSMPTTKRMKNYVPNLKLTEAPCFFTIPNQKKSRI